MKIEEAIGANLARLREEAGLSQAQLGNALGSYLEKPWSRQAVSGAEKGRRAFTAAELIALALSLGVSLDFLLMPVSPQELTDLLPGKAEITAAAYERAVVGAASDGGPNDRDLARAQGALVASLRSQIDTQQALQREVRQQALLLGHASIALGVSQADDAELAELLNELRHVDETEGGGK
ncbi:helix-turn-helix domain-containing protein [Streptomyces griseus]